MFQPEILCQNAWAEWCMGYRGKLLCPCYARRLFDSAERTFRQVTEMHPQHAFAWYALGIILAEKRENDQALAALETAQRLDPQNNEVIAALSYLRRQPQSAPLSAKTLQDRRLDIEAVHRSVYDIAERPLFNGSLATWRGRTWLAYRIREINSRLAIVELDPNWQPIAPPRELKLGFLPEDKHCQEDPRLFVHQDRLHICYLGCADINNVSGPTNVLRARVCFLRLDEKIQIEKYWHPRLEDEQKCEKNWSAFSHDGVLYAVYSIQPHRVLTIGHEARNFAMTDANLPSALYGQLRGGASPVLHNGEYWSFFHGRTENPNRWTIGLYTFEARPPFRPRRFLPNPLLAPNLLDKPSIFTVCAFFPCGALYRDGRWYVSYGAWDMEVRLASWDADELDSLLVKV